MSAWFYGTAASSPLIAWASRAILPIRDVVSPLCVYAGVVSDEGASDGSGIRVRYRLGSLVGPSAVGVILPLAGQGGRCSPSPQAPSCSRQ